MRPALILFALLGTIWSFAANAEDFGDWFVVQDEVGCAAVSKPIQSVDKQNGKVIREKRRDVWISVKNNKGVRNPVFEYRGDYGLSSNSGANWIDINNKKYELFPNIYYTNLLYLNKEFNEQVIRGLMNGSGAVVVRSSPRGRAFKTENTYSLVGAAQAISKAGELCGGKTPKSSPSASGGAAAKSRTQEDSPEK